MLVALKPLLEVTVLLFVVLLIVSAYTGAIDLFSGHESLARTQRQHNHLCWL
jgi:hypothetical protein